MNTPITPTRLYIKQCSHCELKYYGKHDGKNIEAYRGSGKRWKRHLKKHKATVIHLWNSEWFFDTSITEVALKFSIDNNIVESDDWANMKFENGLDGGKHPEEIVAKISAKRKVTMLDPVWKATVGAEAKAKEAATKLDPGWQATKGAAMSAKMSATFNDIEWKATVGAEKAVKISAIRSEPSWKATVGAEAITKKAATESNPHWQATIGAEMKTKISATKKDPEWKAKHSKTCEHCTRLVSKTNYIRWHGDKCKQKLILVE